MKDDNNAEFSNAQAFDVGKSVYLTDVLMLVKAELDGNQQRDTLSAFNALETHAGVNLATTPANAMSIRPILLGLNAIELGISQKRIANIRSLIKQSVTRFGMKRRPITKNIDLTPEWRDLMALAPKREYRWSLSRLACYCSVTDVSPVDVGPETLLGLHTALEGDCTVTKPRGIIKQTISIWNMCRKAVPVWPQQKLSSPFIKEPFMFKLGEFPDSFLRDVDAWISRMTNPDPLDPDAPVRASRKATLEGYVLTFRRLGSALVRENGMDMADITSLDILADVDNLKAALRYFINKSSSGSLDYAGKMATQMTAVAKYHLKLNDKHIQQLEAVKKKLGKERGPQMGKRNRERLKQFDDPEAVLKVLRYPAEESARAKQKNYPQSRIKGMERALIVSILIFAGLRAQNLRTLHLTKNIRRSGDRVFLEFTGTETKTHAEHTVELPRETIELLDEFIADHRIFLPGSDGPYLFPSPDGGPRGYSSIRHAVSVRMKEATDISMSPHLFRHFVAKIVAERQPELLVDVSRRLGHKSFNTTYQSYLGTETPATSRRVNALLAETATPEVRKIWGGKKR